MMARGQHQHYLYVSWGGSGRASSLRHALELAEHDNAELIYLAVLDDRAFPELDASMSKVVISELTWLLETQIDMARHQTEIDRKVKLEAKRGIVGKLAAEAARTFGTTKILVGAPIPVSKSESVEDLMAALESDTGLPVVLILPSGPPV